MKPILVYGSKDFALVIRDLVEQCGRTFAGFIDDTTSGPEIVGDYAHVLNAYPPHDFDLVIAIGYNHLTARWNVYQRGISDGYTVPVLMHPRAYVRNPNAIGAGAFVMAGAIVDIGATVGELAVLWPGANVSHNSAIGANTFLSPNATVCGFTHIGRGCFIGAGAVIVEKMEVPPSHFIKAGTVYSPATKDNAAVVRMIS